MKEIVVDHEVIIEQTLSYILAARTALKSTKRDFDIAFLPLWYHFYTWILQASAYSLLKNKKKIVLIFACEWDKINVVNQNIWPFLWKIWKFDKNIKGNKSVSFIDYQNSWFESIHSQLGFLRILFDIDSIIPIFVGNESNENDFFKFISKFDIKSDFNLVFCSDLFVNNTDKVLLAKKLINPDFVLKTKKENNILNLFWTFVEKNWLKYCSLGYNDLYSLSGIKKDSLGYLSVVWK